MGTSRGSARRRRPKGEVGRTGARFPPPAPADEAAEAEEAAPEVDDAEAQAEADVEVEAAESPASAVEVHASAVEEQASAAKPVEATAEGPAESAAEAAEPPAEDVPAAEAARADEAEEPPAEPAPAEAATDAEPAAEEPAEPEAAADETKAEADAPEVPFQRPESLVVAAAEPDVDEFESDDVRSWVRPYVWTGGRTSTSLEFALETLVSAREQDRDEVLRDVHQQVLELCEKPRSVSEIAALLSVPLGAAKALLGVMAEENLLVVHRTGDASGEGPGLELMERVLRGLRNL